MEVWWPQCLEVSRTKTTYRSNRSYYHIRIDSQRPMSNGLSLAIEMNNNSYYRYTRVHHSYNGFLPICHIIPNTLLHIKSFRSCYHDTVRNDMPSVKSCLVINKDKSMKKLFIDINWWIIGFSFRVTFLASLITR